MPPQLHAVPAEASRVIGYIRVSTAREEMISPELQRQAIEDYCTRKGYILTEVIEDLDATGRNFARKGIQRAIESVERSGIAVVVVWKFSRFGRNRRGWALNLGRVEDAGGRLESATEEVDTTTSTGRLGRGMLAEFAAFESDRAGEDWTSAHKNRLGNGLPHTGGDRFGYLYHRTTTSVRDGIRLCPQGCERGECETGYVPNPGTRDTLAAMYDRYNSGDRMRSIAIWLNDRGIRTARGGRWTPGSVRRTMDSGFAAGLLRVHRKGCNCKSPTNCPNNDFLPGAHEPIISRETWDAYGMNRARRATYAPRTESTSYPLSGLIICDLCRGPMSLQHRQQVKAGYIRGYIYYCGRNMRARFCTGSSVRRGEAESRVLAWLRGLAGEVTAESEQVTISARVARTSVQERRKSLLRDQQQIAEALSRLTVQLAKGVVPEAAYESARAELEGENAVLVNALDALDAEDAMPAGPPIHVVRDLIARWDLLQAPQKRELLSQLLTHVAVRRIGRGDVELTALTTWGSQVPL